MLLMMVSVPVIMHGKKFQMQDFANTVFKQDASLVLLIILVSVSNVTKKVFWMIQVFASAQMANILMEKDCVTLVRWLDVPVVNKILLIVVKSALISSQLPLSMVNVNAMK